MMDLYKPTIEQLLHAAVDLTQPDFAVHVQVAGDRVWINVDGVCLLRICRAPEISVEFEGKQLVWKERG